MAKTLTYSDSAGAQQEGGWVSFYSFIPEMMQGMNNYFYSFKGGNLFRHNTNELRCNFYGVQYNSTIKSVFNQSPLENKLFRTFNIEGDDVWDVSMYTDIQTTGYIEKEWFEKKEQSYFAFIRNSGEVPALPSEYALRSMNGIGNSLTKDSTTPSATVINFSISPLIPIGNIVSVGDLLYYGTTPVLCGQITAIQVDYPAGTNRLIVDTTITGGTVPPSNVLFYLYIKNSVAESQGVLGHYAVFEMTNDNVDKVELFVAQSQVQKSFP